MIASACLAARLPPSAFGVEPEDVPLIGLEMLDMLLEQSRKAKGEEMLARLRERTRG